MQRQLRRYDYAGTIRRQRYGAFDIETDGLDGPILGVGWQVEGEDSPLICAEPRALIIEMFSQRNRDVKWYCHNAGEFDLLHLRGLIKSHLQRSSGWEMRWTSRGDGHVIGMQIRLGKDRLLEIRDSMALLPISLEAVASSFAATKKMTGAVDFAGGEKWDIDNPIHAEYLKHDVTALLESMVNIRELLRDELRTQLRLTAASTSMKCWQRHMPSDVVFVACPSEEDEAFIRKGYYGGLTFLTSTAPQTDVRIYDVNSLYPYAMRENDYPTGPSTPVERPSGYISHTARGHLGMWLCRVSYPWAPQDGRGIIPIIPHKDRKGGTIWPVGDYESVLTTPEIEYGRELGYRIEPQSGMVWYGRSPLFREYIDILGRLKESSSGAMRDLSKILMNSLYGKFGQRRKGLELVESDCLPDMGRPALDGHGEIIPGLYEVFYDSKALHIQPQIAAYVTAYARIHYHRLLTAMGGRKAVIYGDTDSAAVVDKYADMSAVPVHPTRMGALKFEGHYRRFHCVASKTWSAELDDGSMVYRSKGIPRRLRVSESDRTLEWDSLRSTRVSLRQGGKVSLVHQTRSVPSGPSPDRWNTLENGDVYPLVLGG